MSSHYAALNIQHNATTGEIHRAFRLLARRYHPDRNRDESAADRMVGLNEAYQCLIDPVRRRAYDRRFVAPEPLGILDAVLDAARDRLRHPKWRWRTVGGAGSADAVLEKGDHRVGVRFIGVMGPAEMTDWAKALMAHAGPHRVTAAVCLAYRVVPDLDLPGVDAGRIDRAPPMTVIDLVGSRAAGARIPEPCYHELFEDFLIE